MQAANLLHPAGLRCFYALAFRWAGERRTPDATYEVPVLRIDDLVLADSPVVLIQLDAGRKQRQAITGAQATIRCSRPGLIVETVRDDATIAANLVPLGYAPVGMVGPNALFVAGPERDVS